jgi:hypothetical protein
MFCPNCGRDNPRERRFCAACGTNLEIVSQALTGSTEDFFTKLDAGFDQFTARYVEHVFKSAPSIANDRSISGSWKLLGQGVITSFIDLFLFSLMWNVLPLRFLILLISTPIRVLSRRSNQPRRLTGGLEEQPILPESLAQRWLDQPMPSVSEHTTEKLEEYLRPRRSDDEREDRQV